MIREGLEGSRNVLRGRYNREEGYKSYVAEISPYRVVSGVGLE